MNAAVKQKDEPFVLHPFVRAVEMEAIAMYRAKHADGPLWQELSPQTRLYWRSMYLTNPWN